MLLNPFTIRGMIKSESSFWDRSSEINMVYSCLFDSEEQPQSVAIVGQRKIGKSSLLYRIYRKRGAPDFYSNVLEQTACIMLSMQSFENPGSDDFYARILDDLQTQDSLPSGIIRTVLAESGDPETKFRRLLRLLDREEWIIILLLDEFEAAASRPNFDRSFFDRLRAAAQEWRLAYIVATQTNLDELWSKDLISSPVLSPFFNFFYTLNLVGFEKSSCEDYLKHFSCQAGIPFSDEVIEIVQRAGGTHPFFVNVGAYHAFQLSSRVNGNVAKTEDLYQQILQDRAFTGNFNYYWNKLSPQQMNALRLAAHDALPAQLTQETIVDLEHLRKMSLLSYSPASGYSPFSIAFRDFIISIAAKYFSGDSLPDRQTQDTLGAISELISQDESTTLEFKSSLRWDYRKSEKADYLELEVIGTIAAFLNTDGGTLIIGVDDDGKPLGLNNDYGTFTKSRGRDGFHRHLLSLVSSRIALEICTHVAVSFESCEGLDICRVVVKRSPIPVYVDKERKFYIRRGNANYTLDTEQTVKYCQIHWS